MCMVNTVGCVSSWCGIEVGMAVVPRHIYDVHGMQEKDKMMAAGIALERQTPELKGKTTAIESGNKLVLLPLGSSSQV